MYVWKHISWRFPSLCPQLMASHEHELQILSERLDTDRQRSLMSTRDKIAERKRRKMKELRRKQEAELTKEMLTQKKEVDEVRTKQVGAKISGRRPIDFFMCSEESKIFLCSYHKWT